MQPRLTVAAFVFVSMGFSQSLPSYQWMKEVDASGMDSLAGIGTDAQGNIYIAGSTSSPHFPLKNAVQPGIGSAGLYRVGGTTYTPLGLSSASSLAIDPQNPATIFAVSKGSLLKSIDAGLTFAPTTLKGSQASSIAIDPSNGQILFAGTTDQGILKSLDGGSTWAAANNGLPAQNGGRISVDNLWIDPADTYLLFASTANGLAQTMNGGASWQLTPLSGGIQSLAFDSSNAAVVYVIVFNRGPLRSADYGQTFAPVGAPAGIAGVFPDPIQPGRLIGVGTGLYQSADGGVTWTQQSTSAVSPNLVTDPVNGVYYAADAADHRLLRISGDLKTVTPVGPPATANVETLAVVNGQLYAATDASTDVFVSKLDPAGNVLYATYFGGSASDHAASMTVDAQGNVFVAGTTVSGDFPVTKGAYASSGTAFLFRLNPDGSLGYSTLFTGTAPAAVATDGGGSAWLLGNASSSGLPVTPGALAPTFCCSTGGVISVGPANIPQQATLTRFSPSGSSLTFSTYIPGSGTSAFGFSPSPGALALAPDGGAYAGGFNGIFHIDSTGSTLLSSITGLHMAAQAMTLGPDGSLYAAGTAVNFQATPGAFQTAPLPIPLLPLQAGASSQSGIIRLDAALKNVLAATFFGNDAQQVNVMTTDPAGNLYIAGSTPPSGLPTLTPLNGGFASPTGFMSELSPALSSLLFSSYFGDTGNFAVSGIGLGVDGSVVIGGATNQIRGSAPDSGNVWLNSLVLTPPPPLRIDSVVNAASLLDSPLAAGETILVNGVGFSGDAKLTIAGAPASPISISPTTIVATVPDGLLAASAAVAVQSGGVSTNQVVMPVAITAPGIFSQNGTGYGQGYILNKDGKLNSPSNPAAPGDRITIFATGVGPMTFTPCCAVTGYPVNIFIDGIYCNGVAAIVSHVDGLPGAVYQITVFVPNPAVLFADAKPPFVFPPLDGVVMQVNGARSQQGIAISIQ